MISGITWKCLTAAVNLHRDIGRRQYNHCGFMLRRFQGFKVASDIKTNKKQIVSVNGELTIKPCFIQYTVKNTTDFYRTLNVILKLFIVIDKTYEQRYNLR